MTFYQELQLDQIGSKRYLKNLTDPKEKRKHTAIFFRYADMGIQNRHGVCSLLLIFAIATPIFGLPGAIFLRIFNNAIGSLYGWLFDTVMGKISEVFRERTAAIAD